MRKVTQAVILAGGLGIRLRPFTYKNPKPMVPINNRPFLEYLVEMLKNNGIGEIVLLLGYLPEKITEHFGDGSKFGVNIKYSIGKIEDETGTRIKNAEHLLDDIFLLMYSDNYWPLNLEKLTVYHEACGTLATVTVYTNKYGVSKNNVLVNEEGFVKNYDKTRMDPNLNGLEIGFFIMNKKITRMMPDRDFSLEKELFPVLIKERQLAGFRTDHRYYSIGDNERLPATERFLKPKKIIFLDRDGVINKKPPKADYVKTWQEFEFLPGAIDAVKLLNKNGYKIYVITNQPGIARGVMTKEDINIIHSNFKKELEKHEAKIDGIYCCFHGWNEGCECRKPKPGLLFQAAHEHDIDLTKAIFIGDDERDREAGQAAGCQTLLISENEPLLKTVKKIM